MPGDTDVLLVAVIVIAVDVRIEEEVPPVEMLEAVVTGRVVEGATVELTELIAVLVEVTRTVTVTTTTFVWVAKIVVVAVGVAVSVVVVIVVELLDAVTVAVVVPSRTSFIWTTNTFTISYVQLNALKSGLPTMPFCEYPTG